MTRPRTRTLPTRRLRLLERLLLTVGVLACLSAAALLLVPHGQEPEFRDLDGNAVTLDPGESLAEAQHATPSGAGRLRVPAVRLDVPLGRMDAVDGVVTPPSFMSAFLIANRGVGLAEAASGTVYVAMHSLRGGGRAPGNALYDAETGRAAVADGDAITVGGLRYRVTGTSSIAKGDLPGAADLWADVPGRLVVITCLEQPDGSASVENFVVTAALETAPAG